MPSGNGVAWASGAHGTVLRTEDSGYVWQRCPMPQDAEGWISGASGRGMRRRRL